MSSGSESLQQNITDFWNVVAPYYESHPGNTVPFGSEAHGRWVDLFSSVLPTAPADVLDLGTGTGFSALISASLGHRVVGMDLAAGMLEVAREMAAAQGFQVLFQEGDAVAPPFEEAMFDAITCRHLLWTLRSAKEAISNWKRLLRPGGKVVAIDGFRPCPQPAVEDDPDDVFGRHYTPVVQAAIPLLHVQHEAPVIEVFREGGFTEITVEALPRSYAVDDEEEVRPYMLVAARRPID